MYRCVYIYIYIYIYIRIYVYRKRRYGQQLQPRSTMHDSRNVRREHSTTLEIPSST